MGGSSGGGEALSIAEVGEHLTRDSRRKGACVEEDVDFPLKILASMSEFTGGSPSVCGAQGC